MILRLNSTSFVSDILLLINKCQLVYKVFALFVFYDIYFSLLKLMLKIKKWGFNERSNSFCLNGINKVFYYLLCIDADLIKC